MNISLALIVYLMVGVGLRLAGHLVDWDKWERKGEAVTSDAQGATRRPS